MYFSKNLTMALMLAQIGSLSGAPLKPQEDSVFLKKAAFKIDQQVAAFYRDKKLDVPKVTDDASFLRRAFLVTIGRIPTVEEAIAFIEIDEPNKRELLTDYLLSSKGYSSHMSNWAFDLLRITDARIGTTANNEPYRHWVRQAMIENRPWDDFMTRLIASKGDGWDSETAAVGYYTRDRGMPLDNLSNTMRVFLGARMECAQCHDDPFGTTERHDFYQLAAFTHGQSSVGQQNMEPLWEELRGEKSQDIEYRVAQVLWDRVYGMSLNEGGAGQISLPEDYQYRDGKPGDIVAARTPFGQTVRMSDKREESDGREKLASWISSRTGDQFPTVIANRMWKRIMGKGVYEPVDEYLSPAKTAYPEIVTYLGELMVALDYDLRAFQRVLLLTRTFQFEANPNPSSIDGGDDFHGRQIERLSSEQIWDSLITLVIGDPDIQALRDLDDRIYIDRNPVLVGNKNMKQLSKEVLALQSEFEFRAYFKKFFEDVKNASAASAGGSMMSMSGAVTYPKTAKVRASELPSPPPRDHFLYLFGASDREVVDAFSREPNVGQVLSLMNGFVQSELINNSSAHLYESLKGASTDSEKIRRLYLAILNRPPTADEMSWMLEEVEKQGAAGYRNVVSALVMSSEFLFLQ